jgi:ABC-type Na+ efflux pump permease subunit
VRPIGLLVAKDLRVLWRSRGLLAALVLYPIVLALLVALVADEAGARPRIAWVDPGKLPATLTIGSTKIDYAGLRRRVADRVDLVDMDAADAQAALDAGSVSAVVQVPPSLQSDLRTSVVQPKIDVTVRRGAVGERALREVQTFVYQLNSRVQGELLRQSLQFLGVLGEGGTAEIAQREITVSGLHDTADRVQQVRDQLTDPAQRASLQKVLDFARTARLALAFADPSLRVVAAPVAVHATTRGDDELLGGRGVAVALAAGVVLGGLLLGTASLATEREERTLSRLLRGRLGSLRLVLAKVLFTTLVGLLLAILLVLLQIPASGRGNVTAVLALTLAGAAAGACGVLVAALVRDLAAAAFVALLVAVPFLIAALVGRAGTGVARLGAAFPFGPASDAVGAALDGGDLIGPLWHLALLAALATGLAAAYVRR